MYKFLCGHMFLFLLDIYLGVKLMGHMVTLYLTIWGHDKLFFKVAALFLFPPSIYEGFIFSIPLLTFVIVCLFEIVLILVIWSCVSLWFCLAFHWWLILLSFLSCAYCHLYNPLEKCLFKAVAQFKVELFVLLLLSSKSSLDVRVL